MTDSIPYVGDPLRKPKRPDEVGLLVPVLIIVSHVLNKWLGLDPMGSRAHVTRG